MSRCCDTCVAERAIHGVKLPLRLRGHKEKEVRKQRGTQLEGARTQPSEPRTESQVRSRRKEEKKGEHKEKTTHLEALPDVSLFEFSLCVAKSLFKALEVLGLELEQGLLLQLELSREHLTVPMLLLEQRLETQLVVLFGRTADFLNHRRRAARRVQAQKNERRKSDSRSSSIEVRDIRSQQHPLPTTQWE